MSVLIKGMEMPTSCNACMFCLGVYGEPYRTTDAVCLINTILEAKGELTHSCPLVEVPTPHGRLIDADELLTHVVPKNPDADFHCVAVRDIENAPTVIEAKD